MASISIPRGSVEHILAPVTADVTLADEMTVEIAIGRTGTETYVWLPAAWTGAEGTTRTATTATPVTFSAANYPRAGYQVYVRLTDSPEIPIVKAGTIGII